MNGSHVGKVLFLDICNMVNTEKYLLLFVAKTDWCNDAVSCEKDKNLKYLLLNYGIFILFFYRYDNTNLAILKFVSKTWWNNPKKFTSI